MLGLCVGPGIHPSALLCGCQERLLNRKTVEESLDRLKALKDKYQFRPQLMYNLDESAVQEVKKKLKLITRHDDPTPVVASARKGGEHITLCVTVAASGEHLKSLVIFPLKHMPPLDGDLEEVFCFAGQSSGWMTSVIFNNFLINRIFPQFASRRAELGLPANEPVLLVFDGASTHLDLNVDQIARDHNVHLFLLPAHSSTLMQPLDLRPFARLKSFLSDNFTPQEGEDAPDRRNRLMRALNDGLSVALAAAYVRAGWRESGLEPFDKDRLLASPLVRMNNVAAPAPEAKKRKRGFKMDDGRVVDNGTVFFPAPAPAPVSAAAGAASAPKVKRPALLSVDVNRIRVRFS